MEQVNRREFTRSFLMLPAVGLLPMVDPSQPQETEAKKLARWCNELNCWRWPDDLPGKPDDFDDWPLRDTMAEMDKYTYIGPITKVIERIIGKKEILRWHWLHNLEETNEAFELWWKDWDKLKIAPFASS